MSRCREKVSSEQLAVSSKGSRRTVFVLLLTAHCLLLTGACRRDMQDQPKMKPYRSTTFFTDGQSSRQLVEGTVPRGFLKTDTEFFTGKKASRTTTSANPGQTPASPQASGPLGGPNPAAGTAAQGTGLQGAAAYPDDLEVFPIPVTRGVVVRGKERYEIFCSACHGLTGNGDGMIVRRGFRRAASFNDDRLRQAPVGHYFDAITNGWGAMPSYAPQIPAQDRWAIVAYIRALQLSQQVPESTAKASPTPAATSGGQHP
jgi:mono/diheme cytochrome c family protein